MVILILILYSICLSSAAIWKPSLYEGYYYNLANDISICSYPKAGSTQSQWILAAIAGYDKSKICKTQVWFDKWNTDRENGGTLKVDAHNGRNMSTRILILRDPFPRAVSMYNDQMFRGHWPKTDKHNVTDFKRFLDHLPAAGAHTGHAKDFCPLLDDFTIVVDLENIPSWYKAMTRSEVLHNSLNTGWENCTHGSSNLIAVGSTASHKSRVDLNRFCTEPVMHKIAQVFESDYKLLNKIREKHKYIPEYTRSCTRSFKVEVK